MSSAGDGRGTLRERVARLLRSRGYRVRVDEVMVGRSGRRYEVQAYAEYRAPLLTFRIAVACLERGEPVGADEVYELLQALDDLGLDRGIIATTSWFTPEAIEAAGGRVSLWDGPRVEELTRDLPRTSSLPHELRIYHVPPRIGVERAVERIRSLLKRPILGKRETLASRVALIYLPVYEFRAAPAGAREGASVALDALTGDILIPGGRGIRRVSLPRDLTEVHLRILSALRSGPALVADLAESLGLEIGVVDSAVRELAGRGLVDDSEVERVRLRIEIPTLEGSGSILRLGAKRGRPGGRSMEPRIPVGEAAARLEILLGVETSGPRLIFLPHYYAVAERDGSRRVVSVDGVYGSEAEGAEELIQGFLGL